MMRTSTARRGMTLIEILFAFAIIASVLTVAYASALRAWRTAVSANQRTQAQYIAQDQIELLRAYRSLSNSSTPQKGMDWQGFLDDHLYKPGTTSIRIEPCSDDSCVWNVVDDGGTMTVAGDNSTSYDYAITAQRLYCVGDSPSSPSAPADCPSGVASVDVQAKVTWKDASGSAATNELIATTQVLAPTE